MADQKKYTGKLAGARILIVGGSAGLGFGVAEAALEYGASVVISSSQQSRVDEAIASLQKSYPSAKDSVIGYACDLGTEATLEENVKDLLDKTGIVDHIVYTAGDRLAMKPIEEIDFAALKKGGMVRFFAPFLICKYAFANKLINPGPKSSITLTTGSISQKPKANWSIPAGYAGGLHSMTRQLAVDLKPIRVNLISPGPIDTPLWDWLEADAKKKMFETTGKMLLTGRVGQVEDVTEAYLYLMKDQNVTGSVLSTNGGSILV
jgi:NAD(P)-dependent dehydrogenase (short-subunit alcohol dehydrogenase family)